MVQQLGPSTSIHSPCTAVAAGLLPVPASEAAGGDQVTWPKEQPALSETERSARSRGLTYSSFHNTAGSVIPKRGPRVARRGEGAATTGRSRRGCEPSNTGTKQTGLFSYQQDCTFKCASGECYLAT